MIVPEHQATARMTIETSMQLGAVELTSEAKDFCQNAVSISTSARLPNFRTKPNNTAAYLSAQVRWSR